jgi:hypothetical protein
MKELERIKAYIEKATDGPWEYTYNEPYTPSLVFKITHERRVPGVDFFEDDAPVRDYNAEAKKNHVFIAQSRTDLPKVVEALEGVLKWLEVCELALSNPSHIREAAKDQKERIQSILGGSDE